MALRLGSPTDIGRLRLQWHSMRGYLNRQTFALANFVHFWRERTSNFLSRLSLREWARQRQRAARLAQLDTFSERYEKLVDLLCGSAREGVDARRMARYRELREWMLSHYGSLRPRLRPYLSNADSAYDAFECLFAPQELEEVINDLSTIANIMETREVLDAYQETLK